MAAPSAAVMAAVMTWVSQTTGLPPAPLPRVVLTVEGPDHSTVIERRFSRHDGRRHAAAMTMPGVVYLPPDWDEADVKDTAILAHEFVHVLQFASGKRYPCVGAMEPLAWFVEDYYLAQSGFNFWQTKGTGAFAIAEAASCQ